jgi:hypothetical protein
MPISLQDFLAPLPQTGNNPFADMFGTNRLQPNQRQASLAPNTPPEQPPLPGYPGQPTPPPGPPNYAGPSAQPAVAPAQYAGLFSDTESKYGLPTGYLPATASIESSFNPRSRNELSGAAGMFQFIPSTARQYGLRNPYDVAQSTDAAARLAADNQRAFTAAIGRQPTAGELYLAHQQGVHGAIGLLRNPNAPATSIVGRAAVTANGGHVNMTAKEFADMWTRRFGRRSQPAK